MFEITSPEAINRYHLFRFDIEKWLIDMHSMEITYIAKGKSVSHSILWILNSLCNLIEIWPDSMWMVRLNDEKRKNEKNHKRFTSHWVNAYIRYTGHAAHALYNSSTIHCCCWAMTSRICLFVYQIFESVAATLSLCVIKCNYCTLVVMLAKSRIFLFLDSHFT